MLITDFWHVKQLTKNTAKLFYPNWLQPSFNVSRSHYLFLQINHLPFNDKWPYDWNTLRIHHSTGHLLLLKYFPTVSCFSSNSMKDLRSATNPELFIPSKELKTSCSRDPTKTGRRMFVDLEQALCHSVMRRQGEGHIWWALTDFRSWHEMCWAVCLSQFYLVSLCPWGWLKKKRGVGRLSECERIHSVPVLILNCLLDGSSRVSERGKNRIKKKNRSDRWQGGPFLLFRMNMKMK